VAAPFWCGAFPPAPPPVFSVTYSFWEFQQKNHTLPQKSHFSPKITTLENRLELASTDAASMGESVGLPLRAPSDPSDASIGLDRALARLGQGNSVWL